VTQNDLNRAISRATGETVSTIRRIGFLIEEPHVDVADADDPALGPHVLDWDVLLSTDDEWEPLALAS
jgi:hypothetical protein